jgi:16S rRNA (adenine1518-N6/adenine1519-N6)-dimethyltransferase
MHTKPKKRLGQNFLIDKNILKKIVDTCELRPSDIVLEIGAGRGELTRMLAERVKKVYALEIDPSLCNELRDSLKGAPNIEIIKHDILKFNLKKYFSKIVGKIKVIGNIPYYISSPIIEYLIRARNRIDIIFITVQREFAKRMAAPSGSKVYGAFSCFVQYYSKPKIILNIKKNSFFPKPKVDSCLVRLEMFEEPKVSPKDKNLFFKIIRAAFNKRRKTLRNSLEAIVSKEKLDDFFSKYGVDSNTRPEDLTLEDFANLANIKIS